MGGDEVNMEAMMDKLLLKHSEATKKANEENSIAIFAKLDEQTMAIANLKKTFDDKIDKSMAELRAEFRDQLKDVYTAMDKKVAPPGRPMEYAWRSLIWWIHSLGSPLCCSQAR